MSEHPDLTPSPDVSLLLRAHAEQRWLSREVVPVLRQIETREQLPEEQLAAALAYLEVIWTEAGRHARETDSAHAPFESLDGSESEIPALPARACSYYTTVRRLREAVARRVTPLIAPPSPEEDHDPRGSIAPRPHPLSR